MSIFNLAILPGLVALMVSFLATPLVIKLAWKLGIIDDPAKNKQIKVIHTYPVPRGGGLALFVAILVASAVFLPIDKHLKGILGGAAVLTLMGILDDKYNLNPYLRLAGGFLAAAIPIAAGIGIAFLSNPQGGIIDLSQPQINFYFLAGYLLAVLAILSTTKVGTLIVVLGIPLIDTGYTIVRRILARKSPVWGDRGHFHHRLLDAGWGKRRVAVFYWVISAFLGMLALNLNTSSKLYTMVGIAILLGGTILWLTYRPKS